MATYIYRTVTRNRVTYKDSTGEVREEYFRTFNRAKFLKENPGSTVLKIEKRLIKMKLSLDKFMQYAETVD